ncbi:MAG: zinc ribbon domain-containing protein [Ktedonobacteraceae bacterium]
MFCMYCGNRLPDDALFCNKCGSQQTATTNTAVTSSTSTAEYLLLEALPQEEQLLVENAPTQNLGSSSTVSNNQFLFTKNEQKGGHTLPRAERSRSQNIPLERKRLSSGQLALMIVLILLLAVGSVLIYVVNTTTAQNNLNATATAVQSGIDTTTTASNATSTAIVLNASQYDGTWLNDDPNTNDIPEVIISNTGQILYVHPYGACVPTYCDWGTVGVNFESEPFTIQFLFDGSRPDACCTGAPNSQLTISFANADRTELQVVADGITNNMHRG